MHGLFLYLSHVDTWYTCLRPFSRKCPEYDWNHQCYMYIVTTVVWLSLFSHATRNIFWTDIKELSSLRNKKFLRMNIYHFLRFYSEDCRYNLAPLTAIVSLIINLIIKRTSKTLYLNSIRCLTLNLENSKAHGRGICSS